MSKTKSFIAKADEKMKFKAWLKEYHNVEPIMLKEIDPDNLEMLHIEHECFCREEQKKNAAQARHEKDGWRKMTPEEMERCERICTEARKRRLQNESYGGFVRGQYISLHGLWRKGNEE